MRKVLSTMGDNHDGSGRQKSFLSTCLLGYHQMGILEATQIQHIQTKLISVPLPPAQRKFLLLLSKKYLISLIVQARDLGVIHDSAYSQPITKSCSANIILLLSTPTSPFYHIVWTCWLHFLTSQPSPVWLVSTPRLNCQDHH